MQSGVVIGNSHDEINVCEFEHDDIEGVHGHDVQQNHFPCVHNKTKESFASFNVSHMLAIAFKTKSKIQFFRYDSSDDCRK